MPLTVGKAITIALARQRRKAKEALDRALRNHGEHATTEDVDVARRRLAAINAIIEEFKNE